MTLDNRVPFCKVFTTTQRRHTSLHNQKCGTCSDRFPIFGSTTRNPESSVTSGSLGETQPTKVFDFAGFWVLRTSPWGQSILQMLTKPPWGTLPCAVPPWTGARGTGARGQSTSSITHPFSLLILVILGGTPRAHGDGRDVAWIGPKLRACRSDVQVLQPMEGFKGHKFDLSPSRGSAGNQVSVDL